MTVPVKPYPAYKDSGVPWLGEVPAHWTQLPGRACYREKKVPNRGMQETTVLSLSYGQIVIKPVEKLHGLVPASFETYQIIDPGNIIVRPTDLQNDWNSLRFGLARHRGIITSAYMCLNTQELVTHEYGHLLLHAYDLKKVFYGLGSGLRQNLDWRDLKYLPCLVPPPDEQRAIVRYLDHVDRRIRRYIGAKQKLVALLNEQKQAIIQQAVTRGLDPSVQLKPSGVEWLGEVPEHWEVVLNQRIFQEEIRPHGGQTEVQLSLSQRDGLIATSAMQERSLQTSTYDNWKVTLPGDLVLNRFKAHLGVFFSSTLRGIVSFHYGVFVPRRPLITKYFELLYHTDAYKTIYAGRSNGMTVGLQNLSNQNFYNVRSVVPPIQEQVEIVAFAEKATERLNDAIQNARREIALLREYRARLVADVVTGKLDVREATRGLPEELEEAEPPDEAEALLEGEEAEACEVDAAIEEADA